MYNPLAHKSPEDSPHRRPAHDRTLQLGALPVRDTGYDHMARRHATPYVACTPLSRSRPDIISQLWITPPSAREGAYRRRAAGTHLMPSAERGLGSMPHSASRHVRVSRLRSGGLRSRPLDRLSSVSLCARRHSAATHPRPRAMRTDLNHRPASRSTPSLATSQYQLLLSQGCW